MEIAIALDTYDDLFSDFDIRDYGERALSKDFLDELRLRLRRAWEKGDLSIVLLSRRRRGWANVRRSSSSGLAQVDLERRDHYRREDKRAKLKALCFIAVGLALSIAANVIVERFSFLPLFKDFLLIPAWFFVWSGFDFLIKGEDIRRKKRYYAALSASRTVFRERRAV